MPTLTIEAPECSSHALRFRRAQEPHVKVGQGNAAGPNGRRPGRPQQGLGEASARAWQ